MFIRDDRRRSIGSLPGGEGAPGCGGRCGLGTAERHSDQRERNPRRGKVVSLFVDDFGHRFGQALVTRYLCD